MLIGWKQARTDISQYCSVPKSRLWTNMNKHFFRQLDPPSNAPEGKARPKRSATPTWLQYLLFCGANQIQPPTPTFQLSASNWQDRRQDRALRQPCRTKQRPTSNVGCFSFRLRHPFGMTTWSCKRLPEPIHCKPAEAHHCTPRGYWTHQQWLHLYTYLTRTHGFW